MKRVLLINFVFIVTVLTTVAQTAPAIQWQNAIGGKTMGYVNYMTPTKDSGYIAVGSADSVNGVNISNYHGNTDVWVAKLDGHCNIIWQKCFGGSNNEWGYKAEQTKDGGYIIAGETGSTDGDVSGDHGGGDFWILKLDNTGNLQWQKCFGGSREETPNAIIQTNDGSYIVVGATSSNDGDVTGFHQIGQSINDDGWVVKMDSVGNLQWQKCLGGSDDDEMFDCQKTNDGGYIVAGGTASNDGDVTGLHGDVDAWVVKLTNKGVIEWQKCYGGSAHDYAIAILKTPDSGYLIGGGQLQMTVM